MNTAHLFGLILSSVMMFGILGCSSAPQVAEEKAPAHDHDDYIDCGWPDFEVPGDTGGAGGAGGAGGTGGAGGAGGDQSGNGGSGSAGGEGGAGGSKSPQ